MENQAHCDYTYTFDTYKTYYKARSKRSLRALGVVLAVCFIPMTLVAVGAAMSEPSLEMAFYALFMAAFAIWGVWLTVKGSMPMRMAPATVSEFFKRHNAVHLGKNQWEYHEIVTITDEGIKAAYGQPGTTEEQMETVFKGWSQWQRLIETDDYLIVLCKAKTGRPLTALFGFEYQYRMEERNKYEDAVIPKDAVEGMEVDELRSYLKKHIKH